MLDLPVTGVLVGVGIYGEENTIKADQRQNGRIQLLPIRPLAAEPPNASLARRGVNPAVLLLIRFLSSTVGGFT